MAELLHLAIDSSASRPTVAVLKNHEILAEWVGPSGVQHHETLLRGVDSCLKSAGHSLRDLAYLSVGIGPGMFTGLRIGVVTAKFLADPMGIPCVPVSSLMALAHQSASWAKDLNGGKLWVLGDARSQRVYSLGMDKIPADFTPPFDEEEALSPEQAALKMKSGDALVGEGALLFQDRWPSGVRLLPADSHVLKAGAVGQVGAERFKRNFTCSATELEPKYLKTGQAHL